MLNSEPYTSNQIFGSNSMCVTCLAFSALTIFSPVTEAPQPVNGVSGNVSNTQVNQVTSMPVAEEARMAIAKMLKQLPSSSDTSLLREELKSLQTRLAGVKDDAKAEAIIDEGLNTLSERVMAAPNSERIVEVLFEMGEVETNPQRNSTQSKLLQSPSSSTTASRHHGTWGWLS